MSFVFNEEVIKSFEVIEGGRSAKIKNRGERVAQDEVIVCSDWS